jgi:hypothetical protein
MIRNMRGTTSATPLAGPLRPRRRRGRQREVKDRNRLAVRPANTDRDDPAVREINARHGHLGTQDPCRQREGQVSSIIV